MEILLTVFIMLLVIVSLAYLNVIHIPWAVHRSMVRENNSSYGKTDHKKFVEEFNKVEWIYKESFKDSLFSIDNKDQVHASIIEFNGKGMIINNPISYLKVRKHIENYIKENFNVVDDTVKEWR